MKAKVKDTGEIIEVYSLYPVTYSRLDCNGKIKEEYDYDELEFEPGPTMVSLDEVCEWVEKYVDCYAYNKDFVKKEDFIKSLRKEFE